MIGFPAAPHKNMRLSPRIEPTALDQERSFLLRIEGHSAKKNMTPGIAAIKRLQKPA